MIKYLLNIFSPYKRFLSEFYLFLNRFGLNPQIPLCYGIRKLFVDSVPNYSIENMGWKYSIITTF